VRDSTAAATSAISVLKRYIAIIKPPCTGTNPNTRLGGNSAAMTSAYTGRRAEHVMSGTTIIVSVRSRCRSIVRVARIAGTAHA
jgi:hypothetical protein